MAKQTNLDLRLMTFYQVFPRQHSKKQNFEGVIDDLDRIKNLGFDVLYLLPVHPIGKVARKGIKGSPYAIMDYYGINEEYGTLKDFEKLVEEAHQREIKVMMDIVINHTSRDSVLTKEHPDWFYHGADGSFANRVGDWSDITDLDYNNPNVCKYIEDMLFYWAKKVDGFRCDVAPLLPLDFWLSARSRIDKIKPDFIWLTESVEPGFIKYLRDNGFGCHSDSEMYQAFDICYDYDIFGYMAAYLEQNNHLAKWIDEIERQETMYPQNYVKLRSFENHDQERLRNRTRNYNHFIEMVALSFFLKGSAFVYAGMEHQDTNRPSLFDDDLVRWNQAKSIESFLKTLIEMKKMSIFRDGNFNVHHKEDVVVLSYENTEEFLLGVFNLEDKWENAVPLKDGNYLNMLNGNEVKVKNGILIVNGIPIIIQTTKDKVR